MHDHHPDRPIHWFLIPQGMLPDAGMADELLRRLGGHPTAGPLAQELTAYDSVDRRLVGSGQGLVQSAGTLRCLGATGDVEIPWNAAVGPIPWQVLAEPLRDLTRERLRDRVLVPLARMDAHSWTGLAPDPAAPADAPGIPLTVVLLRAEQERWSAYLALAGDTGPLPFPPALAAAVRQLGLTPCDHPPLLAFIDQLSGPYPAIPPMPVFSDPAEPSLAVVRRLVAACLARLRALEPGIIDDLDPSFLHQYRVTLRTTRSLCKLLGGVLDEATSLRLKTDLGDLARAGNALRDLDVHLVDRERTANEVPPLATAGVLRLLDNLSVQRQEAQRLLADRLRAPQHTIYLDDLERLVHGSDGDCAGPAAGLAIAIVARQAIWRSWRAVRRRARRVDADTDDRDLHELRIRVKRLRYLLDMFGPLVAPRDEILRLMERVKELQSALGDFNDAANQLGLLLELARFPGLSMEAVHAAGVLAGILTCRKRDQRSLLDKLLTHATGKAMRRACERCFAPDMGP